MPGARGRGVGQLPAALAYTPATGDHIRHVSINGSDGNDGLSPGRAKRTIQAAIDSLGAGNNGDIFVAPGTYVEAVQTKGAGQRIIGLGGGMWSSPTIRSPTAAGTVFSALHERCTLRGMQLMGYNPGGAGSYPGKTFTGRLLYVDTLGGNSTFEHLTIDNDPSTDTSVEGGTGIEHGAEMCTYRDIVFGRCQLAVKCLNEGTTSTFDRMRPSECRQELLFEGNSGGNLFLGWKSASGGQREHVGGTDDFTHKVVNVNANGNTFINCDWSESHAIFHEVSGAHNVFINHTIPPASRMDITGQWNEFLKVDVQGSLVVTGNSNNFRGVWPHLGDFTVQGVGNVISDTREDQRGVLGTGYLRGVTNDVTDANRALTLARTPLAPGDLLPQVFEPVFWLKADDLVGSDGDPVSLWPGRGGAAGTGNTTSGASVVTNVAATSGRFKPGQLVWGAGIPLGAQIRLVDYINATITLSVNCTATATGAAINAGRDAVAQATAANKPTLQVAELNGHKTVRWDTTPNDVLVGTKPIAYKHAIVVMKHNGAAWAGNEGVLTSPTSDPDNPNDIVLAGSSGGTTFVNDGRITTDYHMNGAAHAEGAMDSPMDAWGIVSISNPAGWNSIVQLGHDRDDAARYFKGDIAEVILLTEILPDANRRALEAKLGTDYAITVV